MLHNSNFCNDCGKPSICHVQTWLDELINRFLPRLIFPRKIEQFFDAVLEKVFIFLRLTELRDDFKASDIQLRSFCLIEELRKRGAIVKALRGPAGFTNRFRVEINNKNIRFEGLPIADFVSKCDMRIIDDKQKTKIQLEKAGFPVVKGKAFWFLEKKKAIEFGINKIGFPLVVKPCGGSVSRHVTTNIQNFDELKKAINNALIYSPIFMIEKFISNVDVYRATVIDFDFIACVKQIPANVTGDGVSLIRELIDKKNSEPRFYKIDENKTTEKLSRIPKKGEIVFLQQDPFLKKGGDLIEITAQVHPNNSKLFCEIAKLFDIRVVGIDFLCQDISRSWKEQKCAILELNSVPCIEMHHFPYSGTPQNVAKPLADLFFKYYL